MHQCTEGGYSHLRHNGIRDTIPKFIHDLCHGVEIEPLQSLQDESFDKSKTIEARSDIKTNSLWGHRFTRCFFDVKIFNPLAKTSKTLLDPYKDHEKLKKLK